MSSILVEHSRDNCRKDINIGEEEISTDMNLLVFSEDSPDLCVDSAPKAEGSAYKRRKLHGNTVALLSEESAGYITTAKLTAANNNLGSDDDHYMEIKNKGELFISGQRCLSSSVALFPNCIQKYTCIISENFEKEHVTSLNGHCSLSKGNVACSSASVNMRIDGRKSSDAVEKKFMSPMERCIHVLKSHGLLGGLRDPSASASELPYSNVLSQLPCKICGKVENTLKMLICDHCDKAVHLACCTPKVEEIPDSDWYCQACCREKPKLSLRRSSDTEGRTQAYGDELTNMLEDTESYTSDVRVGKDFQAEVAEWSGSSSINQDYFGEESNLMRSPTSNGWNCRKSTSVGNWVQCREVIQKDTETICGKWRRAPLSVAQTDAWECSCAVIWDPIHADCAVPQELSTSEVEQQLSKVREVNKRLAAGRLQKAQDHHGEGHD